jgi:hypothetical protein
MVKKLPGGASMACVTLSAFQWQFWYDEIAALAVFLVYLELLPLPVETGM